MSNLDVSIENPYRSTGQVATGDRFVGRADQIRRLQDVWTGTGRPSNLRVLGHHRIGKTSIVQRALATCPSRPDLLTVHLNIGRHASGTDVFRAMTRRAMLEVRHLTVPDSLSTDLSAKDSAVQRSTDWYDLMEAVLAFFSALGEAGLYVLLILDQFDRADAVFGQLADFQLLRDLVSEHPYPIGLITVSRRDVESIEISTAGGSILGGVVTQSLYVGMFTEGEADLMMARAAPLGIALGSVREQITGHCGGHPFLLEMLCNRIVEIFQQTRKLDVELAFQSQTPAFETQFHRLRKAIDEGTEGRGTLLLKRISASGTSDMPSSDLARLKLMGVVAETGSKLRLFCEDFSRYITMCS